MIKEKLTLNDVSKINENKYQCKICEREFSKNGIFPHFWRSHTEKGKKFIPIGNNHSSWNKGLTKETSEKVKLNSENLSKSMKKNGNWCKGLTKDTNEIIKSYSEKIRKYALENHNEKNIIRRRKDILYEKNGEIITLQSTYELKVAEDLDKNNVNWTRCSSFPYVDQNGIKRTYYPDFYLVDYNVYLDPKNNYLAKEDHFKIQSAMKINKIKVIILRKDDLSWEKIQELIKNS